MKTFETEKLKKSFTARGFEKHPVMRYLNMTEFFEKTFNTFDQGCEMKA